MAANDQLINDSDFIYTQYQEPEAPTTINQTFVGGTGSPVLTINGVVTGPSVTFAGASSGFSYAASGTTTLNLVSALTTKGDLYTWSTVGTRLGVGANGTVLTADSGETTGIKWAAPTTGTVTSFSATPTGIFDVATDTTTPALSLDNQSANTFLRGPTSGGAATPSFGVLVDADLPQGAWSAFTPTVATSVGAITTLGAVSGGWKLISGKTAAFEINVAITTNGTGAGTLTFSLPFTASAREWIFPCGEVAIGADLRGYIAPSGTVIYISTWAAAYPGASGTRFVVNGICETT